MNRPTLKPVPVYDSSKPKELHQSAALVVDGNPSTRMTLAGQLRGMGLQSVSQTSRISEARRELERNPFDVVICGDQFPKGGGSGQELLDDLHRSGLLPYATVFMLLTDEATYLKVSEAAESAVDSYIVRPYSAGSLQDRIEQARLRKAALLPIDQALDAQQAEEAVRLARERVAARGPQWQQAGRLGAEVLLRLERMDQARDLFQLLWDADPKPWALLGVARAQLDAGSPNAALATLQELLEIEPNYPEAYDVQGRAQMELGQFQAALACLQKALSLTPLAIGRQQRLGMLAFFAGNRVQAVELLERSARLGLDSKMFDSEALVLLALAAFAHQQPAQLERHLAELRKRLRIQTDDLRLQRFTDLVAALSFFQQDQVEKARNLLALACDRVMEPSFDMEAALNLLCALSMLERLKNGWLGDLGVIERIGHRFATSKAMGDLLSNAASAHPPFAEHLQQAQDDMVQLIERALKTANNGAPQSALQDLLHTAESTHNARTVASAWLVLQRYGSSLAGADELRQRVGQLRTDYGTARNKPALGDPRLRPTGGVNLGALDRPAPPA
ncbi:MAG: tetratricopeptide repeat protein [Serpentinimonas sp.]|nr:tetratricopeptide repeat protein [Serpentinimonas sp.]